MVHTLFENQFAVEVRLSDQDLADEIAAWLRNADADDVAVARERGIIDPLSMDILLTFVTVNLAIVARVVMWVRDKTMCRTVYDLRNNMKLISLDCSTRDGTILIIDANSQLTIHEPDKLVDLDKLLAAVQKVGVHAAANDFPDAPTSVQPLAAQESVARYRRLANTGSGEYEPELANALTNLAPLLNQTGRPAEAQALRATPRPTEPSAGAQAPQKKEAAVTDPNAPQRIFIVHGRDTDAVNDVKVRVFNMTGIMPQILADQPGGGDTIIEKFEREANQSNYAIVLLTPDDEGRVKGSGGVLQARARQNVILELGYFFGKLGRKNVVVLNGDVEQPSDVHGLNYISYGKGTWTEELRAELRLAGFKLL